MISRIGRRPVRRRSHPRRRSPRKTVPRSIGRCNCGTAGCRCCGCRGPPIPAEQPPPAGYPTEVRLPLAADIRAEVERVLLDPATAEDLFWALTELAEIDLPGRSVRCGLEQSGLTVIDDGVRTRRYRTADRFGDIPAELLVEPPRRGTAAGSLADHLGAAGAGRRAEPDDLGQAAQALAAASHALPERRTIGAPTPTDEPITLPARLIGTFPVDDTRRRLAVGALTDYLLEQAADTYLDLLAATEPADRWTLIPAGGFPAGPVDGALRAAILDRVADTPLLGTALGDLVTPADACLLPGLGAQGAVLFGEAIPGLLPPQSERCNHGAARIGGQHIVLVAGQCRAGRHRPRSGLLVARLRVHRDG